MMMITMRMMVMWIEMMVVMTAVVVKKGVMETVVLLVMWMEITVMIMVTIRIEMTTNMVMVLLRKMVAQAW